MRAPLAALLLASSCARLAAPDPYRVTVDVTPDIRALGSDDLFEQDEAAGKLVALGTDALPALAAALERETPAVRVGVVEVLDRLRAPEAVPLLIRAAHDPAEDVRYDALQSVGNTGDPRGRPVVEAALEDARPRIRLAAAKACATLCASPPAVARLVEMAIADQPLPNGSWARASLVAMLNGKDAMLAGGVRSAIERLALPRLEAGRPLEERARAALLAAEVGNPASWQALADAARDATDIHLRLHAAYALGKVADVRAVPALEKLLVESDAQVAYYVYDALNRMAARGVSGARTALARYRGPRPPRPPPPPGP